MESTDRLKADEFIENVAEGGGLDIPYKDGSAFQENSLYKRVDFILRRNKWIHLNNLYSVIELNT